MKRFIYLTALLTVLILVFTSCAPQPVEPDIYEKLDNMVSEDYSSLTVTVTTENAFGILNSTYAIKYGSNTAVDYTEETFSEYEIADGEYVIPEEQKVTKSGSFTLDGKSVTLRDGITLNRLGKPDFSFAKGNFSSVKSGEDSFSANVVNVKGFLGFTADAENMKVSADFAGEKLTSVVLDYETAAGTAVTLTYIFK